MQPSPPRIVLVEDDRILANTLADTLRREGWDVSIGHDETTGRRLLWEPGVALAILDVNLDPGSGYTLLHELRTATPVRSHYPVLLLTRLDAESDIVAGLELGADDYITKPFRQRELLARVRTRLRYLPSPVRPAVPDHVAAGRFALGTRTHSATKDAAPLELTTTEFLLLRFFLLHPRAICSSAEIFREVWDESGIGARDTVRTTIRRLRRKIETHPTRPVHLKNVPRVGYIFWPDALDPSG